MKTTEKTWFVVLTLIFLFPIGLYFMWKYEKFPQVFRVGITIFLAMCVLGGVTKRLDKNNVLEEEVLLVKNTNSDVADIDYEIIEKTVIPGTKYAIDVRIKYPVSETQINKAFYAMKAENSGYKNYFIHFYLPGMEVGSGAWAVANSVDNNLEVKVLGTWEERLGRK